MNMNEDKNKQYFKEEFLKFLLIESEHKLNQAVAKEITDMISDNLDFNNVNVLHKSIRQQACDIIPFIKKEYFK